MSSRFRGVGLLSRRDRMIVARQFIAWDVFERRFVPKGTVRSVAGFVHRRRSKATVTNQSYRPYGTGRIVYGVPGNELPGYHHSVPTGQNPLPFSFDFGYAALRPLRAPRLTGTGNPRCSTGED